ncbi:hypothetical protein [Streptomyces sp. NPDC059009]|uniref:hypothetical protein n=1 Tax=Streptomyces sp. NPDC059009 TaxID=3346694 RepID=UPI0036A75EDD
MEETTQVIDGWTVRLVWGQGFYPVAIHITDATGKAGQGGITSTVLREIDLLHPMLQKPDGNLAQKELWEHVAKLREFPQGRGSVTDEYLRALAGAYRACGEAFVREPVKLLADKLGRNRTTLQSHLTRARKLGYLDSHDK